MRTTLALGVIAIAVIAGGGAAVAAPTAQTIRVTNTQDSGPGSFRAAVTRANADASIRRIDFRDGLGQIALTEPIVFTGGQALDVLGGGVALDGSQLAAAAPDAFLVTGGGDLSVTRLTIQNAPQQGLTYRVPPAATGVKKVLLLGVRASNNDGHGVLIDDQVAPDDVANPNGSAASLEVRVLSSRFDGNGFGTLDRDGLRVNEGGEGGLRAVISLSRVEGNGGDGIELDERSTGDASFDVSGTQISRNGNFDLATDPDDGMDVDETGPGALIGRVLASSANDNFEEGWDLNENDAGNFEVVMTAVEASGNREEGIDFEEDDDFAGGGDLVTTLTGIKANGNGADDGDGAVKIREKGEGSLDATVRAAVTEENLIDGIFVREDAAGDLTTTIQFATSRGNTGDGVELDENSDGTLTATIGRSVSSSNGGAGVRADGTGTLRLEALALEGNVGGAVVASSGVVVTQTP